jgi:hypothetical protein
VTRGAAGPDPFGALGLEGRRELADDDVRAAWRRAAAATHPDRADGGDPEAFAAAAAAYTVLRTPTGRGEALADLLADRGRRRAAGPLARLRLQDRGRRRPRTAARARLPGRLRPGRLVAGVLLLAIRIRDGRPAVLALRVFAAAALGAVAVAAAGWQPASLAILAGLLTWLARTAPGDLAPAARS